MIVWALFFSVLTHQLALLQTHKSKWKGENLMKGHTEESKWPRRWLGYFYHVANYWFLFERLVAVILSKPIQSPRPQIRLYSFPFNRKGQQRKSILTCHALSSSQTYNRLIKRKRNRGLACDCWSFWGFDGKTWQVATNFQDSLWEGAGGER